MKIIWNLDIVNELEGGFLFLDNSSLIPIIEFPELFSIIEQLLKADCALITIPSVLFEFSRTDSVDKYNKRLNFLKNILKVNIYPIEKHLNKIQDLILVLQKINGRISYSDFLLYCCLYLFKHNKKSFLLTENHRDFLTNILDRNHIITIDCDRESIRNLAIYSFSDTKYKRLAANILKNK